MTEYKGILIKNIYYMLTYAFQVLKQSVYNDIASEEFENIEDLFAAILSKGISQQLKRGLYREYIVKAETLPVLKGKVYIQETIKYHVQHQRLLACAFDELSENNIFNQILKTTVCILLRVGAVTSEHRSALKKDMLFFHDVDAVDPSDIRWSTLKFQRNNQTYRMLMNICFFVLDGLLQTTETGSYRMKQFSDEHMDKLYEKFILEYYRYHHPELHASGLQPKWNLDSDTDESVIKFLPIMQTDTTLRHGDRILIIDAKCYTKTMQSQYDKQTVHSGNLYQIFTYVKNQDKNNTGNVSGMLLYAKTEETITPDYEFKMGGNSISVKTLDLNTSFRLISEQLDRIVVSYFMSKEAAAMI